MPIIQYIPLYINEFLVSIKTIFSKARGHIYYLLIIITRYENVFFPFNVIVNCDLFIIK